MPREDNPLQSLSELIGMEPPFRIDAERAVLSSILVDPKCVSDVFRIIKPEYLYDEFNRGILKACQVLDATGRSIDVVTVIEQCLEMGVFTTQEMARTFLKQVIDGHITTKNVEDHCKIIEDKYYIRALIDVSSSIIKDASQKNAQAQLLLDSAEQRIYDIRKGKLTSGLLSLESAIMDVYDHLQEITGEDAAKFKGTSMGFSKLDQVTTGLNDTDLIILAARPAMGKSAFALNIAVNACKRSKKDTVIFSLEMSPEQVATRMLASESLVNNTILRSGDFGSDNNVWERLAMGTESLVSLPILLDGTAPEMKAKLRRCNNLGLVVIDYLQLMSSPNHHTNRVTEVSEITRQLKLMAKELRVPVVALSQLSREAEKRENKRPMLSDLRESGSIEQDADIILFLYRDAYYDKETSDQSIAECIVAKNRHGQTGTVNLVWRGEYTLFTDADMVHREN